MFGSLPVIIRELRAESRKPATHWLRLASGGIAWAYLCLGMVLEGFGSGQGAQAFSLIQQVLLPLIWIIVPVTTADVISRERRDGTLSLLALTRLTPVGVLLAKICAKVIGIFGWLLAAVPVMIFPLTLGGVGGRDLVMALVVDVASVTLALCAGLLASISTTRWGTAMFRAACYTYLFSVALVLLAVLPEDPELTWWVIPMIPFLMIQGIPEFWEYLTTQTLGHFVGTMVVVAMGTGFIGAFCLLGAARGVRTSWCEAPPSAGEEQMERILFAPRFFAKALKLGGGNGIQRNPAVWLMGRTIQARLQKLGWLLIIAVTETILIVGNYFGELIPQWLLFGGLTLSLVLSAASSFLVERQTGALELLLVTPLTPQQLLAGRVERLKRDHRLPGVLLLVAFFFSFARGDDPLFLNLLKTAGVGFLMFVTWGYIAELGVSQALCRRTVLGAACLTLAQSLMFPLVMITPVVLVFSADYAFGQSNVGLALLAAFVLSGLLILGVVRFIPAIRRLVDGPAEARARALEILVTREFSDIQ